MQEPATFAGGDMEATQPSMAQGRKLAQVADKIAKCSIYLAAFLVPLMYLPWAVNGLEFNKQALVIALAIVGTLAWLGKMLVQRRVEWRRTPINLFIGVYLVIYFVSAWFSQNQYLSFVGDFGQESYGAVTTVSFVLLYLVAINVFKGAKEVMNVMLLTLAAGLLVMVHGFSQALGLRIIPGSQASSNAFNLVGTVNGLGVYAGFLLALLMGFFLMPEKDGKWVLAKKVLMGILGVLALFFIATLSFWVLWLVVVAAAVLILAYGMVKTDKVTLVTMLSIPMALIVVGVLFMFLRFPISLNLPAEVLPSLQASFNVSKDALANSPIVGSGPGTFLFDYTQFRSADLNSTAFWNVHFDRSSSSFLTLLATTGILGFAGLLVLVVFMAGRVGMSLAKGREDWLLRLTIFAGWAALVVGKALYSSNMTLEFMFWLMTTMLVILEWNKWKSTEFDRSPRAALVLSFFFIVAVIFAISGLYLEGQRYVGEVRYTSAAQMDVQSEEDVDKAIEGLTKAVQLNGQSDLYHRTLSQALRLKVNIEAQKAGAEPTAEDARRISVLTANTVNVAKRATDLSPRNVQNWSSLAGMYRDLMAIAEGAIDAAQASYEKASELEPNNPTYYTELGKIRSDVSQGLKANLESIEDEEQKATTAARVAELEAQATENFNKAIELKGDYGPAHYWLAIHHQRLGKTEEALARLQALRNATPDDLGVGLQFALLAFQADEKAVAIAELERLIALSPDYSNARWYLSAMYEDAGRIEDAIAQVEKIAEVNPEDPNVSARLDALRGVGAEPEPEEAMEGEAMEGELPDPIEPSPEGEVIPTP